MSRSPLRVGKWYDSAKWPLERVENFPKSQRFVLGQRLTGQAMDVPDLLADQDFIHQIIPTGGIGRLAHHAPDVRPPS